MSSPEGGRKRPVFDGLVISILYIWLVIIAVLILALRDPWILVQVMTASFAVTVLGLTVLSLVRKRTVAGSSESLAHRLGYPNQVAIFVSSIPLLFGIVGGYVALFCLPARQALGSAALSLLIGVALQFISLSRLPIHYPKLFSAVDG